MAGSARRGLGDLRRGRNCPATRRSVILTLRARATPRPVVTGRAVTHDMNPPEMVPNLRRAPARAYNVLARARVGRPAQPRGHRAGRSAALRDVAPADPLGRNGPREEPDPRAGPRPAPRPLRPPGRGRARRWADQLDARAARRGAAWLLGTFGCGYLTSRPLEAAEVFGVRLDLHRVHRA